MFFRGKRYYSSLIASGLIDIIDKKSDALVQFRSEDGNYYYMYFESWISFKIWYFNIPKIKRTFSEVIFENEQKFKIDIDCPYNLWIFGDDKYKLFVPIIQLLKELLSENIEYIIYESVDINMKKMSFHIVITNYYLLSSYHCRYICEKIKNNISYDYMIDDQVYKSLQCFRLEGSRKLYSNRYKYIIDQDKLSDKFLDGIISNLSNCELIITDKIFKNIQHKKYYKNSIKDQSKIKFI